MTKDIDTSPEKCREESKRYDKILKLREILVALSATAIEDPRYKNLFLSLDALLNEDEEHFEAWVSGFNAEMMNVNESDKISECESDKSESQNPEEVK